MLDIRVVGNRDTCAGSTNLSRDGVNRVSETGANLIARKV